MDFFIYSPLGTEVKTKIRKVSFETPSGYYTLLPRHVDFVSALCPNIVSFTEESGNEKFAACHRGIVVKKGSTVTMSVQGAVVCNSLDELSGAVLEDFKRSEEQRKELNTVMAQLELGLIRGFGKLNGENGND